MIITFDYYRKPAVNLMVFRPTEFAAGDYQSLSIKLPEETAGSHGGAVYSLYFV
jgi:hypothetical protein